jgi:hypothetical protein
LGVSICVHLVVYHCETVWFAVVTAAHTTSFLPRSGRLASLSMARCARYKLRNSGVWQRLVEKVLVVIAAEGVRCYD